MTCACESEYSFPCQFPGETEFFRVSPHDDREWCRFHLPLQDAAGNKSDKGCSKNGWETEGPKSRAFRAEMHDRLHAARQKSARFDGSHADLKGVAFPPEFDFSVICAELYADFTRAIFGTIRFHDLKFGKRTCFIRATFGGKADFTGATFGSGAVFEGATFGDRADFTGATFGFLTDFTGATFGHWAFFAGATFGDRALFNGATFEGDAYFTDAAFSNLSGFAGANFSGSASFATSQEKNLRLEGVNFSNAIFTGACNFDNRSFGSDVNFNGATFEDLAEFHGCEFHPGMSFHQTKFLKTKEDKLNTKKENDDATERLERSYRTLKRAMADLHARNEEADFFALEMECRRQRGSVPRFERIAAMVYKIFSDYGRSIARPLICLGFLVGYGFAYFYHLAQAKSFRAPGDVLRFTMEQIAPPFSIWSNRLAPDPWVARYLKEDPWLLYAPATVMTLTAIGLLTLFLLALRRRFKMD